MELFNIMKKDRYLCNIEELEKKSKINKRITKIILIPIIILVCGEIYFLLFESSIILSLIGSIFILFVLLFEIIFYCLSTLDDNFLGLLLYLKKKDE